MRIIDVFSVAGADNNEDLIEFRKDFALLLDGSTGLKKKLIKGYPSDAIWFVKQAAEFTVERLNEYPDTFRFVEDLILYLLNSYEALGLRNVERIDMPSASMVLIRDRIDIIEIISLGDCTTVVELKSGDLEVIYDGRVAVLDQSVVDKMKVISKEKDITIGEARSFVTDALIANRNKKNTKDGYTVLGLDPIALSDMEIRRYQASEVIRICAFSDGIAEYYAGLRLSEDVTEFYRRVNEYGIAHIISELREAENNDLSCDKYPRLKAKDDASIIMLQRNS